MRQRSAREAEYHSARREVDPVAADTVLRAGIVHIAVPTAVLFPLGRSHRPSSPAQPPRSG
jgi:hypothetical protein